MTAMRSRLLLAAALTALVVGVAAEAAAQQPSSQTEDPSSHFERGVSFFRDNDFTAAMVEFKKAYELDPRYSVLYNIGQTSKELKDYAGALTSFERYLSEGGAEIEAEKRKRVEGWVAELKGKIATVQIKSNVEGAEVAVDDVTVGATPLPKPVVVNAGKRKIALQKSGYAPLTRFVEVAGTEVKELDLELVPLTAGDGGGGDKRPPKPIEHTPWPWVGLGLTGALGVSTGVVGGLALGKKAAFEDELAKFPNTKQAIDDARSSARTFALTGDILGAFTGVGAVLTVVAFAVDYGRSSPADEKKAEITPLVGPGFVGARGTF